MEAEQLEQLWNKYRKLIDHCEQTHPGICEFIDGLGDRIVQCPSATESSNFGAYPGGLIDFSLSVTSKMRSLAKALDVHVGQGSILVVGLTHAIGSIGDLEQDYYTPQDSEWHLKRGSMYKYNEDIQKMSISHRSLYLLQTAGVRLSRDEWIAIATSGGTYREESRFYIGSEPHLGMLVSQARQWVLSRAK